ncbi:MAG TPA: carbon storage regulator [Pirellulales bacterium]|nr:carbon storage regulator [Pirellulales bacterium]
MDFLSPGLPNGGLVVSRRQSEEVVIEVEGRVVAVVQVVEILPDRTRLRIRAPADVVIARAEVHGRPPRPSEAITA